MTKPITITPAPNGGFVTTTQADHPGKLDDTIGAFTNAHDLLAWLTAALIKPDPDEKPRTRPRNFAGWRPIHTAPHDRAVMILDSHEVECVRTFCEPYYWDGPSSSQVYGMRILDPTADAPPKDPNAHSELTARARFWREIE